MQVRFIFNLYQNDELFFGYNGHMTMNPIEQHRFNMIEQQIRTWEVLDPVVLDLLDRGRPGVPVRGFRFRALRPAFDTDTLQLCAAADGDTVEVEITRDTIRPPVVRAQKEGDSVGYLRIGSFNEQTFEGLRDSIEKISREIGPDKLKGYVLDLRNNPGGLLDQAVYDAAPSNVGLEAGDPR